MLTGLVFSFSGERNHYYGNRLKAELAPKMFLSLILDGMDQAKTNLPHVTTISKVCCCIHILENDFRKNGSNLY